MAESCRYMVLGRNTGNVPVCLKQLHEPHAPKPSGAGEFHTVRVQDPVYHEAIAAELPVCIPAVITRGRPFSIKLRRISLCEGFTTGA
ncbi:MAG: hypothetical protein KGJ07_08125 [Patescibacteria group bacterium]|nr:hypothetical protein [Patescibacteria group bacterium]